MTEVRARYRFDGPLAEFLYEAPPTDEIRGGPLLGWFGCYCNRELPGGAILHRDDDGFVTGWYSASTARLDRRWAEICLAAQGLAADPPD